MKPAVALLCLAASTGASAAAKLVDLAWTAEGRFTQAATLAPKGILEVCGKLPPGSRVAWSFKAGAPLQFNVHVHIGKEVVFAARLEKAETGQGLQTFDAEPAHCWMWTNTSSVATDIDLVLTRQPR